MRLHLKAWGGSTHAGGRALRLRPHREAATLLPEAANGTSPTASDRAGTAGALLGPARYLVGWQPVQSLEQLGPLGVFVALQACQLARCVSLRLNHDADEAAALRQRAVALLCIGGGAARSKWRLGGAVSVHHRLLRPRV